MSTYGWIGVDFDGTLAEYHGWKGDKHLGDPIAPMVDRVRRWLADGREVRIVTARFHNGPEAIKAIKTWCVEHLGTALEVTATKDFQMVELWDDRAVQVEKNTGRRVDGVDA